MICTSSTYSVVLTAKVIETIDHRQTSYSTQIHCSDSRLANPISYSIMMWVAMGGGGGGGLSMETTISNCILFDLIRPRFNQ